MGIYIIFVTETVEGAVTPELLDDPRFRRRR